MYVFSRPLWATITGAIGVESSGSTGKRVEVIGYYEGFKARGQVVFTVRERERTYSYTEDNLVFDDEEELKLAFAESVLVGGW